MFSVLLNAVGFSSIPEIPTGPFTYSEAVFAATHNSYSGDLDTETAAGVFSAATTSGERCARAPTSHAGRTLTLTLTLTLTRKTTLTRTRTQPHSNPNPNP